ncbi:RNA polymerase i-specific transcription-initiation factor domain-containing protein [Hirsutella rhossiliensis]|uniref:RNA polymerase i-specific transcription-initiation factor domain-containing protein n=1 Tax=Hirsutella rhossiliensis TaxID=111463 RepID=A0A9P8N2F0_9HYPO|nr:RNA polymerase i-specific transcription-initiation factor domain-containing protein [Hirsutella rhossiliensis]KAH0966418.1 RNA polymerase i-specific transcription-initiation factor domain-containing protein [Hirsutella rhossiliensis]
MIKNRRLADLELGHPGLLSYIPAENPELGPGLLHTTRLTTGTLRFDIVGSSAELYPPSRTANPCVSSQLWRERQLQRRWLLNTHPEAFMGNQSFQGYLKEDMERFRRAEETIRRRPLLAVGLMSDLRDARAPKAMSLLAVAAGESGEQLRLTRMDETQWQWGAETEAVLHLSVIDSDYKEEEALWATDAVPISQVKAATYSSPSNSVRWLLVQKPTWTAILQPEYHPYHVPDDDAAGDPTHQRASYINPNPLLTLHHHQTGGNAHSDVSFNPPALKRPPQLAVLDECGYWTIWNVSGTWKIDKKTLRLSQYKCGHIYSSHLQRGPNFYQVSILGEDLCVRYCVCTTSTDPTFDVSLPTTRIGWSRSEQRRRWKKKRKRFLRRLEDAFVLPDSMGEADMESALVETDEVGAQDSGDDSSWEPRPVLLKLVRISQAIREGLVLAAAQREPLVPATVFDAVYAVLEDGLLNGSLPLTTWAEIADDLEQPTAYQADDDAMGGADSLLKSTAGNLSEELEQVWNIWVSEVVRDVFLSSYGAMVQDVPLLGAGSPKAGDEDKSTAYPSQLSSRSPRITPSSQLEPSSSASLPSTSADSAMQRLKLLTTSLEPAKLGNAKCPKFFSYWPTERGVDTRDYVSSVAISTEEKFQDAKDRLQRREAKRKALAERYKRPAFMRQGFPMSDGPGQDAASLPLRPPPMQIMSSQQAAPESSQTQGPWVTMSQPVAGAFGDRKKGKKGKRKSGFR